MATTPQRPAPVKNRLPPLSAVGKARGSRPDSRRAGRTGAGAGGRSGTQASCGGQSEYTVYCKGGTRIRRGQKIKGRKRHIVVDAQGSVLEVWVWCADVSDARGARVVLEQVSRRYPSAQIVIADGAYDRRVCWSSCWGSFVWR
jgi:hypothetical protein